MTSPASTPTNRLKLRQAERIEQAIAAAQAKHLAAAQAAVERLLGSFDAAVRRSLSGATLADLWQQAQGPRAAAEPRIRAAILALVERHLDTVLHNRTRPAARGTAARS